MKIFESFKNYVDRHFKQGEPITIVKAKIEKIGDKIVMSNGDGKLVFEATPEEMIEELKKMEHDQMIVYAFMKTLQHIMMKDKHEFPDYKPSMN